MLANRMKAVLDAMILKSQSAFVPGRAITDNIPIFAEIIHFIKHKRKGKKRVATLKIDMSKAYDRIKWEFLRSLLEKLDFDARWIELIMLCVTTVNYNVIRGGTIVSPIVPNRRLRQDDPLSPYLFILCAEGLSSLIRKNEMAGFIHGAKVARGAPMVSHLFFAMIVFYFSMQISKKLAL